MSGDLKQLAQALAALGIPADKTELLAEQVDKRARQMAEAKGRTYEEALTHLLKIIAETKQGKII